MLSMEDSPLITVFATPPALYDAFVVQLQSRLPIREVSWKSHSTRRTHTISSLNFRVARFVEEQPGPDYVYDPTSEPTQPILHVAIVQCADNATYKQRTKENLHRWQRLRQAQIAAHPGNITQQWMIINVSAKAQPKSKGIRLTLFDTVFDKIKNEFGNKTDADRCLQLRPENDTSTAAADLWQEVLSRIQLEVASGISDRVRYLEQVLRSALQGAPSAGPGALMCDTDFCAYFLGKDTLGRVFESVNLCHLALVHYDELERVFELHLDNPAATEDLGDHGGTSHRHARRACPAENVDDPNAMWLRWFPRTCVRRCVQGAPICVSIDHAHFRQHVQNHNVSVFELRQYILFRQLRLLFHIRDPAQASQRVLKLLLHTVPDMLNDWPGVYPSYVCEWALLSILDTLRCAEAHFALLERFSAASISPKTYTQYRLARAALCVFAKQRLQDLGISSGILSDSFRASVDVQPTPTRLSVDIRSSRLHAAILTDSPTSALTSPSHTPEMRSSGGTPSAAESPCAAPPQLFDALSAESSTESPTGPAAQTAEGASSHLRESTPTEDAHTAADANVAPSEPPPPLARPRLSSPVPFEVHVDNPSNEPCEAVCPALVVTESTESMLQRLRDVDEESAVFESAISECDLGVSTEESDAQSDNVMVTGASNMITPEPEEPPVMVLSPTAAAAIGDDTAAVDAALESLTTGTSPLKTMRSALHDSSVFDELYLSLCTVAIASFQQARRDRSALCVAVAKATLYYCRGCFADAAQLYEMAAKTFRKEQWFHLEFRLLGPLVECYDKLHIRDLYVSACLRMMAPACPVTFARDHGECVDRIVAYANSSEDAITCDVGSLIVVESIANAEPNGPGGTAKGLVSVTLRTCLKVDLTFDSALLTFEPVLHTPRTMTPASPANSTDSHTPTVRADDADADVSSLVDVASPSPSAVATIHTSFGALPSVGEDEGTANSGDLTADDAPVTNTIDLNSPKKPLKRAAVRENEDSTHVGDAFQVAFNALGTELAGNEGAPASVTRVDSTDTMRSLLRVTRTQSQREREFSFKTHGSFTLIAGVPTVVTLERASALASPILPKTLMLTMGKITLLVLALPSRIVQPPVPRTLHIDAKVQPQAVPLLCSTERRIRLAINIPGHHPDDRLHISSPRGMRIRIPALQDETDTDGRSSNWAPEISLDVAALDLEDVQIDVKFDRNKASKRKGSNVAMHYWTRKLSLKISNETTHSSESHKCFVPLIFYLPFKSNHHSSRVEDGVVVRATVENLLPVCTEVIGWSLHVNSPSKLRSEDPSADTDGRTLDTSHLHSPISAGGDGAAGVLVETDGGIVDLTARVFTGAVTLHPGQSFSMAWKVVPEVSWGTHSAVGEYINEKTYSCDARVRFTVGARDKDATTTSAHTVVLPIRFTTVPKPLISSLAVQSRGATLITGRLTDVKLVIKTTNANTRRSDAADAADAADSTLHTCKTDPPAVFLFTIDVDPKAWMLAGKVRGVFEVPTGATGVLHQQSLMLLPLVAGSVRLPSVKLYHQPSHGPSTEIPHVNVTRGMLVSISPDNPPPPAMRLSLY
eukprot:m.616435 g.616435  ORF g.616435 m.616435 type:complete len:1565 (-) comp22514_c1_seq2:2032-6726(-)